MNRNIQTHSESQIKKIRDFCSFGVKLFEEISDQPYESTVNNWFQKVFGFDERNVNEVDISFEGLVQSKSFDIQALTEPSPTMTLTMNGQKRTFHVGNFWTPTVHEFRSFVRTSCKNVRTSEVFLRTEAIGDVFNVHSDFSYAGATFQVASQFNCLEFSSPGITPEYGIYEYVHDRTQGPACCIPTGPATFFRNYCVKIDDETVCEKDPSDSHHIPYGQSKNRQINCLKTVHDLLEEELGESPFEVHGGYVFSSRRQLDKLNKFIKTDRKKFDQIMSFMRVGVQFGVGVMLDRYRQLVKPEKYQMVSHVFCSGISINYNHNDTNVDDWELFSRAVLDMTYESTVLAAIINSHFGGTNKLVLTLVGGGVFGNKIEWIIDSIKKALSSKLVQMYGLNVVIGTYDSSQEAEVSNLLKDFEL